MKQQKNFKRAFIEHTSKVNAKVRCCLIKIIDYCDDTKLDEIILHTAWTDSELQIFLKKLDFNYAETYYVLLGNIWFDDGSWSNFTEYAQSNFWMNFKVPEIPANLNRKNLEREIAIDKFI